RRDFQHVARDDGLELMDLFGGNVKILAGFHTALGELFDATGPQDDFARQHVNRLVLHIVVLEREHLAGFDVQDLADVAVGLGPDELVPPRLFDAGNGVGHASLSFREEGTVTHAVTHTPQPTQPSGFSTGRPRSSSASAFSPIGHARAQTPDRKSTRLNSSHEWISYAV